MQSAVTISVTIYIMSIFPNTDCMGTYSRAIGCVDLMHKDLMVRLFYPCTEAGVRSSSYSEGTKWLPSEEYGRGYIEAMNSLIPDFKNHTSLKDLMGIAGPIMHVCV